MSEPYYGQIQQFGFDYPPYQWAFCQGDILPVSQNAALYALLGQIWGGNGSSTFALPDLRTRAVCGMGQGPVTSPRTIGDDFGSSSVTLLTPQMPSHTHLVNFYAQGDGTKRQITPTTGAFMSVPTGSTNLPFTPSSSPVDSQLDPRSLLPAGGTQAHENRQPYLATNFSIALIGIFPSFD